MRALAIAVMLLPSIALADTVTLDNGGKFSGVITYLSEKVLSIKSDGSEWTFDRSKVVSFLKEKEGRDQEAASDRARRLGKSPNMQQAQVIVYGTKWCGFCKRARAYLADRNIPFVDRDVERDPGANAEILRKCAANGVNYNGGVPVIDVRGHILLGFSAKAIEQALRED